MSHRIFCAVPPVVPLLPGVAVLVEVFSAVSTRGEGDHLGRLVDAKSTTFIADDNPVPIAANLSLFLADVAFVFARDV